MATPQEFTTRIQDLARLRRGDTVLLPHSAGVCRVTGGLVLIACRPPAPGANGAAA